MGVELNICAKDDDITAWWRL